MAVSAPSPLERAFPKQDLFRGASRTAILLSLAASVLLCLLLFNAFLLLDLLISRGRFDAVISEPEQARFERLTRTSLGETAASDDSEQGPVVVPQEDAGLLPTVWWSRNRIWGGPTAFLYRNVPALQHNGSALISLLLSLAVLYLLRRRLITITQSLSSRAALDAATGLWRMLHRQALRLGPSDLEEKERRHVLHLFTSEVERFREGLYQRNYGLTRAPIELAVLTGFALAIHPLFALEWILPLALLWGLVRARRARAEADRRLALSRSDAELRLLAEGLVKTRLTRGYGMESYEQEQFQNHLQRYRDSLWTRLRGDRETRWVFRLLGVAGIVLLFFLLFLVCSTVLTEPEKLPLSAALIFLATLVCMFRPLEHLWKVPAARSQAAGAADGIFRYLDRIPEVGQAVGARFLQPLSRSLQYDNVTYSAGPRKLLDGFSLHLTAGTKVALVSLDPLESRAAAYMLPRFIEPQSGRVLFDGEDTAWVTLESLRAEAIFVGGDDPFFTGSVLENLRCGNDAYTLQQVSDAAKLTHAHNFILKLPNGYETVLGEHGESLDAGQSFRLGLARAVLRNPALLIVEEPTQALSEDAKSLLDDAYNRILGERTVIFLPSRLSTVRRADQIVLIHKGKVDAIGPQVSLLRESPLYRHWEYMRFNEFRNAGEPA